MDGCLVTTYCWWWTQGKLLAEWTQADRPGPDLTWIENHFQGWMYIWYLKGDTETRVGTEVQLLSNHDPEHSQARQYQQEPPDTNSSKINFWNVKYIDSVYSLDKNNSVIIILSFCRIWIRYICTGHTNTTRQEEWAPGQHLTKSSQIVGKALSREDFLGRCTKKSLLNKVVKALVFKQQIKASTGSVSFYKKQLAGFFTM